MTEKDLAAVLREMYEQAKRNEVTCQVHLFGIGYGPEIRKNRYNIKEIVRIAGINQGYIPEISKGIKLASYVDLHPDIMEYINQRRAK